jgi:hypothetical protein
MAVTGVSVLGAHGQYQVLQYDANIALAQQLAISINAQVQNGTLIPAENDTAPTVPAGIRGEFVQTQDGAFSLPSGYSAVVDNAAHATVSGSFGNDETVMAGAGDFTFDARGGAGTVAAGGGNDNINVAATCGPWDIALGNGNDTVSLGTGAATVSLGSGNNVVKLGGGPVLVETQGATTVFGASGQKWMTGESQVNLYEGGHTPSLTGAHGLPSDLLAGTGNTTLLGGQSASQGTAMANYFLGQSGTDLAQNFTNTTIQQLEQNATANDQTQESNGTTVTLSDHSTVTFSGNASSTDETSGHYVISSHIG